MTGNPIDIVIPWVDGSDKNWIKSRNYWADKEGREIVSDTSDERFRDWDTLKYVFRSIDQYMPWIRKVHFVTVGHMPSWLNKDCSRINVVKHEDFIPKEYLPTFSSHTIELNMHRIKDLAEQFIYFNDDIIICKKRKPEDYYKKGLPCDYGILTALVSSHRYSVMDTALTDIEIINDHFKKKQMLKKNIWKWINLKYGPELGKSILMFPWKTISDFAGRHFETPFLKSTFEEVWTKEEAVLHSTSLHKFRTRRDVNQWLMRDWQLASGRFIPTTPKGYKYCVIGNDNRLIIEAIKSKKYHTVCINDVTGRNVDDFNKTKEELIQALQDVFPTKSAFEK